jgi:hypothetical protein
MSENDNSFKVTRTEKFEAEMRAIWGGGLPRQWQATELDRLAERAPNRAGADKARRSADRCRESALFVKHCR